jgi:hypothetical protein
MQSLLKHPSKRPAWFFHVGRFSFDPLPMTTAFGARDSIFFNPAANQGLTEAIRSIIRYK